jgi:hypothetical protein
VRSMLRNTQLARTLPGKPAHIPGEQEVDRISDGTLPRSIGADENDIPSLWVKREVTYAAELVQSNANESHGSSCAGIFGASPAVTAANRFSRVIDFVPRSSRIVCAVADEISPSPSSAARKDAVISSGNDRGWSVVSKLAGRATVIFPADAGNRQFSGLTNLVSDVRKVHITYHTVIRCCNRVELRRHGGRVTGTKATPTDP